MTLRIAPPHDTGYPALGLFLGLCAVGALVLLAAIIGLEGLVFRRTLPGARAWRDSLIVNIASSILGVPIAWYAVEALSDLDDWMIYPFMVISWGLSVAVEGGILKLLERHLAWRKIIVASAVANLLSYVLMMAVLFLAASGALG